MPSLAIQLISYNRATELDRTLRFLAGSALRGCPVTVLDNASTDGTAEVCAAHARDWPSLKVVRHALNLGVTANYLRAVELSEGDYTWVLGDDDEFEPEAAEELLEIAREGADELIWCGPSFRFGSDPRQPEPPGLFDGGRHRLSALRERLGGIYLAGCFLPNLAFRTALFTASCFHRGSLNSSAHYPQFPFVADQVAADRSVRLLSRQLVRLGGLTTYASQLSWRFYWLHSCAFIEDPRERRRAILEPNGGRLAALLKSMLGDLLQERAMNPKGAAELFWRAWSLIPGGWRTAAAGLSPALLLPVAVCRWAARDRLARQGVFDDPLRL